MSVYDAIVGADEATLNSTVAAFYGAIPSLFTQTFNINQDGITTIEVQFQQAPTLSLTTPSKYREEAHNLVHQVVAAEDLEQSIRDLTAGLMTASCGQIAVTINGSQPISLTAAVTSGASLGVQVNGQGQNMLVLALADATVTVPNEPIFSQMLTQYLAPPLLSYLNNSILNNIQIPALSLGKVTFVTPVVTDESAGSEKYLSVYTGLNPVVLPASGTTWPQGVFFGGADANALNAVANGFLPSPGGSGGMDDVFNLSWDYGINLTANLSLQPGSGNVVGGTLTANGGANITWHTPNWLPNVSFGGSISGDIGVSAAVTSTPSGNSQNIGVTIESVGPFDLSMSIDGLPGPLSGLLGPITSAILDALAPLASSILQNFSFNVYTLNPISMSFAGLPAYQLVLENLQLSTIAGADGLPLATVTGEAAFSVAPPVEVRKTVSHTAARPLVRAKTAAR